MTGDNALTSLNGGPIKWLTSESERMLVGNASERKVFRFGDRFFVPTASAAVEHTIGYGGGLRQAGESNNLARELLIPSTAQPRLEQATTLNDLRRIADRLGIAPAIVAGRIQDGRKDRKDCRSGHGLFVTLEVVAKTKSEGPLSKSPVGESVEAESCRALHAARAMKLVAYSTV